ncbi:hypothetical protein SteCoe_27320 [Stentor coeruleus]|uniref:Translin-associated factor X-interacting protein 1 N-terminal domain-containing protein n=1 Tax=Stentor coeruleus TaxID=5963 RepID=A0A1R2BAV7_9CILI|nr:hypothetical protein SteCoe_27320 [Stentor coeruleus]
MKKIKSTDTFSEKPKPRTKSTAYNHIAFPSFSTPNQGTISHLSFHKIRANSITKKLSSKGLKKKRLEVFKSSLSKSPSNFIIAHTKDDISDISQSSCRHRRDSFIKADELYKKIEKIQSNDPKTGIKGKTHEEKFYIAEALFDEIIAKDKIFGKYLEIVKKCYEEHLQEKIENISFEKEIEKEELMMSYKALEQENESLQISLESISKENLELSKDIEICEEHCIKLQQKLSKVYNVSLDNVPNNPETWKSLLLENQFHSDMCKMLKKELEVYKHGKDSFAKIM